MLSGAELPELRANLLLPEDVALRNLPPLRNAHRRLNFEQDRPIFSALEEVSRADPTPRCKLHVSLWGCCLQSRAWADCSLSLSSWWVPKPSVYRRTAACRVRPSPSQPVGRAGWGAWRCVWLKDAALSCDVGTTLITSQPRAVLQHCHVPRERTFCHPPPAA